MAERRWQFAGGKNNLQTERAVISAWSPVSMGRQISLPLQLIRSHPHPCRTPRMPSGARLPDVGNAGAIPAASCRPWGLHSCCTRSSLLAARCPGFTYHNPRARYPKHDVLNFYRALGACFPQGRSFRNASGLPCEAVSQCSGMQSANRIEAAGDRSHANHRLLVRLMNNPIETIKVYGGDYQ